MPAEWSFFVSVFLKFFFLLTPFFALSMFLSLTRGYPDVLRRRLTLRIGASAATLGLILFFFGDGIFAVFGITLDAFRVGAGALLFLSAVGLVHGQATSVAETPEEDITVVPMAIPVMVGPATIGSLLVLGAEIDDPTRRGLGGLALLLAVAAVTVLLWLASWIEAIIGRRGLAILSKITGLILAALAAQLVLTGMRD
ncbi:MAG: MarC family protein [Phycisphaeraceae bacterium]